MLKDKPAGGMLRQALGLLPRVVCRHTRMCQFGRLGERYPNLDGVIIGMALYEGRVELADLTRDFGG